MQIKEFIDSSGQHIPIAGLTVLIGPNNVGKSRTLQDMFAKFMGGGGARLVVTRDVVIELPSTFDELISNVNIEPDAQQRNVSILRGIAENLRAEHRESIVLDNCRQQFNIGGNAKEHACRPFGRFSIGYLDPEVRIHIANEGPINPADQSPQNLIAALYRAGASAVTELDRVFFDIFSKHIFLDYGQIPNVCLRVSDERVDPPKDPRELHSFAKNYPKLHEQGHGFRSLVGVVLSVMLAGKRCILLDEPEAFLHPFQARTLGRWLAEHAKKSSAQIIVATQNPSFVNGLLSANDAVDFLRLNRTGNTTGFHRLEKAILAEVVRSPLLASQRVTEALFHEGAIVCEADPDRLFYQTSADIVKPNTPWFFLHAHNKQTIHKVVELLRAAAVPVRAIVDIDLLNDITELRRCANAFGNDLDAKTIELLDQVERVIGEQPEEVILSNLTEQVSELNTQLLEKKHSLAGARGALGRIRSEASRWAKIKENGVMAYDGKIQTQLIDILSRLNSIGLFLVPVGELESWLNVGVTRKNEWIVPALNSLQQKGCPEGLSKFINAVMR